MRIYSDHLWYVLGINSELITLVVAWNSFFYNKNDNDDDDDDDDYWELI